MFTKKLDKDIQQSIVDNIRKANYISKAIVIYTFKLEDRQTSSIANHLFEDYLRLAKKLTETVDKVFVTIKPLTEVLDAVEEIRISTGTKLQLDWIFILQETAQRFLSCVDRDNLKHSLKYNFNKCISNGEAVNNFIREHAADIGEEYEENLDVIADKLYKIFN